MTLRRPPPDVINDWYDRKTDFVLQKYGPGPRVHYHTGLAPADVVPAGDEDGLRRQLWRSQEDMLSRAVRAWDAANLGGQVLDVGCGLGGTSLFLAMELGSSMTALSPVARHLEWVSRFALQAGVRVRVQPLLGDAHELSGPPRFDAALSFGATPYFDREGYFESLARAVRPGGWVFIEDTFIGRAELAAPFNDYWTANLGWLHEYVAAAALHGFDLFRLEDVSREAAGFWKLSVAYSHVLEGERQESIAWHSHMFAAYLDGGLRDLLLGFRKR
jgi:tocopherol O-methyltransferase